MSVPAVQVSLMKKNTPPVIRHLPGAGPPLGATCTRLPEAAAKTDCNIIETYQEDI